MMSDSGDNDAGGKLEPSDDTPVTWGDLRRVSKLLSQYHNAIAIMTTTMISAALTGRDDRDEEIQKLTKRAEDISKELVRLVPGADQ